MNRGACHWRVPREGFAATPGDQKSTCAMARRVFAARGYPLPARSATSLRAATRNELSRTARRLPAFAECHVPRARPRSTAPHPGCAWHEARRPTRSDRESRGRATRAASFDSSERCALRRRGPLDEAPTPLVTWTSRAPRWSEATGLAGRDPLSTVRANGGHRE